MATNFDPYAFANQPSPLASVNQGIATGVDWAMSQTALDLKRQQVQNDLQQHQEQKRQFDVTLGKQLFDQMTDAAMSPDGPVKNAKIDAISQFSHENGGSVNIDPTMVASLKDQNYKKYYAAMDQAVSAMQSNNPEAYKSAMANVSPMLSQKASLELFEKQIQYAQTLNAIGLKNQGSANVATIGAQGKVEAAGVMGGARQNSIDNTNQRKALTEYNAQIKPIQFSLDSVARLNNIFDDIDKGKIKSTAQVAALISNEEARLATQKNNFGEGTANALAIQSYIGKVKQLGNKIADIPGNTVSAENMSQARAVFDEMRDSSMEQGDRTANQQMAGLPPVSQAAIKARHTAFQNQYSKKFGSWNGPGLEDQTSVAPIRGGGVSVTPPDAQAAAAPQAVQLKPEQLQAAQQIKQALDKMPAGPARNKFISKIQNDPRITLEMRQKAGLP